MQRVGPLLLLALPVLLAGCADRSEWAHLAEGSWQFERIDGQHPNNAGARITFDDDRIGIKVGCNHLGGPWRMDRDRLFAGPLDQTETACPDADWNQEKAVGALLVATPRLAMQGDRMILRSSGHTAELVRVDDNGG